MAPAFTDYCEVTMANTRDRRSIIPPIRFRYGLDPIDRDQSPCHPPVNNDSSTLTGSARPVSETYFQSTDVCPSCQTSNHRKSGRYCASCGIFYHLACARLKKAESSGLRTWLCQRCLFPEHATLSSSQPSTAPSMNQHLSDERELLDSPNCVDNADNVLKRVSQLRRFYRIPIRIPKSCRIPVAEALAEAIDRTITSASNTDWNNFVSFPILALGVPISPNNAGSSLSSVIRAILKRLTQSPFDPSTLCQQLPCHQARRESSPSENLRSLVNTKLMLNDIKAAIRVVSSDDTVLEVTPGVLQALILKHPSEPEDSVTPIVPAENIAVTADEKKIIRSLRSFSGGCCGGIDGLRPAHLLDLVAVSTAEAGLHLRRSITNLTNKILRGDVSDYAVKLLFSSNLTALKKKDGGIRPIAVGNVFRRLAAKVGCYAVSRAVSHELLPIQLGVSVKGGAEAAVHAVRTFITNNIDSSDHKVIVKLDMMNAFNSVRRDHVLQTCLDRTPEIAKLAFLAYSKPSSVIASGHSITSSTGIQQGDPIGPLLFALTVDQIANGIDSELNVWYLDDATIGGSPESVLSDVQRCITGLKRIGLIVNPKKTEIINVGLAAEKFSRVVNSFNELLPEIKVTELTKMELLGSPILADATRCCIVKKLSEYKRMIDRILLLDGHPGLFLLKKCLLPPAPPVYPPICAMSSSS